MSLTAAPSILSTLFWWWGNSNVINVWTDITIRLVKSVTQFYMEKDDAANERVIGRWIFYSLSHVILQKIEGSMCTGKSWKMSPERCSGAGVGRRGSAGLQVPLLAMRAASNPRFVDTLSLVLLEDSQLGNCMNWLYLATKVKCWKLEPSHHKLVCGFWKKNIAVSQTVNKWITWERGTFLNPSEGDHTHGLECQLHSLNWEIWLLAKEHVKMSYMTKKILNKMDSKQIMWLKQHYFLVEHMD